MMCRSRKIMKNKNIRIILADDHTIVRQGLSKLLNEATQITVIGEATNGREAVTMVEKLRPDVVIMDIAMPLLNGIEATRQIKRTMADTKIIILSMHAHNLYIRELLNIGVSGYLLKDSSSSDVLAAIMAAIKGDIYLSPSISSKVVEDDACLNSPPPQEDLYNKLSNREREVFQMIVEGRTTREISEILYISPSTVKSHRSNIMDKLQMNNLSTLIQYAIHLGIIDIHL